MSTFTRLHKETKLYKPDAIAEGIEDASSTAIDYVTEISSGSGIEVHPRDDEHNKVQITPSGMEVFQNDASVAAYGSTSRIGKVGDVHVIVDQDSLDVMDGADTLATFGESTRIGKSGNAHVTIDQDSLDVMDGQSVLATFGESTRIGLANAFNSVVQAGLFAIRYATDRLFSVTSDGWQTNIYMGGSTVPSGVGYTDSQLLTIEEYLRSGCTTDGLDVYDPQGGKTGYQLLDVGGGLYKVIDGGKNVIESATYEAIYFYYSGTDEVFTAEPRLYPQSEIPATPANIDMGGVGIGAADGLLTIRGRGVVHSGDIPWTNLTLSSGATAHASERTPKIRKWGPVVTITGAAKPTAEVAADGTLTIGTVPDGCIPKTDVVSLQQGSGKAVWMLRIEYATGVVTASRYRNGDTPAAMTATGNGTWLPLNVTYMV